jgi:biopolymer transport protein ExbB
MRHIDPNLRVCYTKAFLFAIVFALLMWFTCHEIFAQGETEEEKRQFGFFQLIFPSPLGAMCMIPLIFLSVAMVALVIENLVTLQKDKLAPPATIADLENLLNEQQLEEAINLCDSEKNYITNTVGVGLVKVADGANYEEVTDALAQAIDEENLKLQQKVSWLALIGNIGPMLGLFGTVTGMVAAFMKIAELGNPTPQELAAGIFTALITTVTGLIVAIPALAAFFWFRNRVGRFSFELAGIAIELVDRIKELAKK